MSAVSKAVLTAVTLTLAACVTRVEGPGPARLQVERAFGAICAIDGAVDGFDCPAAAPPSIARNAMLEVNPAAATIADALDRAPSSGPLHGVPVVLKANIETADAMTTTAGSMAMAGFRASEDAAIVRRLRDAGLIILGKANLSEWANFRSTESVSGWSSLGGQTRHALDPARNPCGSSSGSAVVVATGQAPLAIGTETDGSIICPSSINGIVGIKPTLGLVSRSGIIPLSLSQDTAGPMARSVREAGALLAVIAGPDAADPATAAIPAGMLPIDPTYDPDALRGRRIGVLRNYGGVGRVEETDAAFERAVARLARAGAEIIDGIEIDRSGLGDAEYAVLLHEFRDDLNAYLAARDAPVASLAEVIAFNEANAEAVMPWFGQDILIAAEATGGRAAEGYAEALATSKRIARDGIDQALAEHALDAIVAPSNGPAWLIDYEAGDRYSVGSSSLAAVSGYPSITVPAGTAQGQPFGLSLIGPAWSDQLLIELAYAFEQATGD